MQFFIHRSEHGGSALTPDSAGQNLPPQSAPWTYVGELDLVEGAASPSGLDVIEALRLLDRDGYYIPPPSVELDEDAT
ncbi:MAG: hypothetical protein H7317_14210 [Pseudorhodobacter sp.]|nr:hypothetical protein [Pseudorhodobacter sp.]